MIGDEEEEAEDGFGVVKMGLSSSSSSSSLRSVVTGTAAVLREQ